MKLALLGVATTVLGAALGVAGLLLAGGLWVVLGLLIWALFTRPTPPSAWKRWRTCGAAARSTTASTRRSAAGS